MPKKETDLDRTKKSLDMVKKTLADIKPVNFSSVELKQTLSDMIVETGSTNALVLWPLRVALSGQATSPGVFEIAEVLGKEETLRRVDIALKKIIQKSNF